MEKLKQAMENQRETLEKTTYANVTTTEIRRPSPQPTALHSVVVSSKNVILTREEALAQVRIFNAKEVWVRVVRKAKDQKFVVGCSSQEERERVKEKLRTFPILILWNVLAFNWGIFNGMSDEFRRISTGSKVPCRKARNPLIYWPCSYEGVP